MKLSIQTLSFSLPQLCLVKLWRFNMLINASERNVGPHINLGATGLNRSDCCRYSYFASGLLKAFNVPM